MAKTEEELRRLFPEIFGDEAPAEGATPDVAPAPTTGQIPGDPVGDEVGREVSMEVGKRAELRRLFPDLELSDPPTPRQTFDTRADEAGRNIAQEIKDENAESLAFRIRTGIGALFDRFAPEPEPNVITPGVDPEVADVAHAQRIAEGAAQDVSPVAMGEQMGAELGLPAPGTPAAIGGDPTGSLARDIDQATPPTAAEVAAAEMGMAPPTVEEIAPTPVEGEPVVEIGEPSPVDPNVIAAAEQDALVRERATEQFRDQGRFSGLKRARQVATTGLRNAPGLVGAFFRTVKPEDTLVEQAIESGMVQLTPGEKGLELAGTFIPPIAEVLITKKLASAAAPALSGRAKSLAEVVGRSGAGSRAGGAATGVLEGLPTDLAIAIENQDAGELGIGAGIGAITGLIFPGGGAVADEVADMLRKDPSGTASALADLARQARREGSPEAIAAAEALPSQLEVAMARALRDGDDELARGLDEALDAMPSQADVAARRAEETRLELEGRAPEPEAPAAPREPGVVETPARPPRVREEGELPTAAEAAMERTAPRPDIEPEPQPRTRDPEVEAEIRETVDRPAPEQRPRRVDTRGLAGAPDEARFTAGPAGRQTDEAVDTAEDVVDPVTLREEPETGRSTEAQERRARIRRRLGDLESESLRRELAEGRETIQRQQRELEEAFTDPMTGLPNPTAYGRARARLDADPETFILSADATNLKAFNDEIAPEAGDEYLKMVAEAVAEAAEEFGVPARNVFRAGGDEFVVAARSAEEAEQIGRRATEILGDPPVEGTIYSGGLKYGVAGTRAEADELLNAAKAASDKPRYRGGGDGPPEDLMAPRPGERGAGVPSPRPETPAPARGEVSPTSEAPGILARSEGRSRLPTREEKARKLEAFFSGDPKKFEAEFGRKPGEPETPPRDDGGPTPSEGGSVNPNSKGGFVADPVILRAMAFPAVGATAGAATAQDGEDRAGRAGLGATMGLIAAFSPNALDAAFGNSTIRKQFTPGGELVGSLRGKGREVQEQLRDALGRLSGQAGEADEIIRQAIGDVAAATKELYGGPGRSSAILSGANPFESMPDDVVDTARRFMHGDRAALNELPEPLRLPLANMRQQVDRYSEMFMKEGIVEGELAVTFDRNLGSHLTRSYRVFDVDDWQDQAPKILGEKEWEQIQNNFKRWYRDQFPGVSEDEVHRVMEDFTAIGDELNPIRALQSGRLGKLNTNVLKERKALPDEVRALWGEHDDPYLQFARTVTNQANYVANYRFLKEFREQGLGEGFLFDPKTGGLRPEGFTAEIASEGSKVMAPLKGLRTTPEIAKAFAEQFSEEGIANHPFLNAMLAFGTASKVAKTVGSQVTHLRNLLGNVGFAAANGFMLEPIKGAKAAGATIETIAPSFFKGTAAGRAEFNKLRRLGVIGNAARAGELQQAIGRLEKTKLGGLWEKLGTVPALDKSQRFMQNAFNAPFRAYQVEDDIWKVLAFNVERSRYAEALSKAGRNVSDEELDEMVARVVRNTWPSFDQTPRAIQTLGRVGGFVSFPAEVFRTINGTMRQIQAEMADPALRGIGAKRLAGASFTATSMLGMGAASGMFFNVTRDEENAIREFLPPWSENSTFVHMQSPEDGKFKVIDLSYITPYSYLQAPINAFMRGEDWKTAAMDVMSEVAAPWSAGNPGFTAIFEELLNADREVEAEELIGAMLKSVEPSVIEQYMRLATGRSSSLRPVDRKSEAAALFLGIRGTQEDIREGFGFDALEFKQSKTDAGAPLRRAEARGGVTTRLPEAVAEISPFSDTLKETAEQTVQDQVEAYRAMIRKIEAAMTLGVTRRELDAIMKERRVSERDRKLLLAGATPPTDEE